MIRSPANASGTTNDSFAIGGNSTGSGSGSALTRQVTCRGAAEASSRLKRARSAGDGGAGGASSAGSPGRAAMVGPGARGREKIIAAVTTTTSSPTAPPANQTQVGTPDADPVAEGRRPPLPLGRSVSPASSPCEADPASPRP